MACINQSAEQNRIPSTHSVNELTEKNNITLVNSECLLRHIQEGNR